MPSDAAPPEDSETRRFRLRWQWGLAVGLAVWVAFQIGFVGTAISIWGGAEEIVTGPGAAR